MTLSVNFILISGAAILFTTHDTMANLMGGVGMRMGGMHGMGTGITKMGLGNGVGLIGLDVGDSSRMGMSGMPIRDVNLLSSSQMSGSMFDKANKGINDHFFNGAFGNQGTGFNLGQSGLSKGENLFKNSLGNVGFWNDMQGGKNLLHVNAGYIGGHSMGKKGIKEAEAKADKDHKKGYTVKGFKTSHQSDESSNTEEVYDEAMDEEAKKAIKGEEGQFEKKSKGVEDSKVTDVKFDAKNGKTEGKFANDYLTGKSNVQMGGAAGNKYAGDSSMYGMNNGGNLHDQAGHHESSKYAHHYPIHF